MILGNELQARVWTVVQPTYDVGNFSGSILAAVQLLGDVIRNKSGLDADGQSLVGQAFGGSSPIIRLNSLRTESERDEQKGVELLLRGNYTGLRNPRSHDAKQDSAETAHAIIYFIDWLLGKIDKSKSPFEPNDVLTRVWDEHFVPTTQYAALLAAEVPAKIRLDVLLRLIQETKFIKLRAAKTFLAAMLPLLTPAEVELYWEALSERLRTITTDTEFVITVRLASVEWQKCSDIGRLRAENRLLRSLREGKGSSTSLAEQKGWLGLFSKDIYRSFTMKEELEQALFVKLSSFSKEDRDYVLANFMDQFIYLHPVPHGLIVNMLTSRLQHKDVEVYNGLSFLDDTQNTPEAWRVALKKTRDECYLDDIPF